MPRGRRRVQMPRSTSSPARQHATARSDPATGASSGASLPQRSSAWLRMMVFTVVVLPLPLSPISPQAGDFDVRVSRIDRMLEPRSYIPNSAPFDITSSVWGQKWGEWFKWSTWDQGGRIGPEPPAGEEPPADIKAYYDSYINSLEAVSDEDYRRYRVRRRIQGRQSGYRDPR